MDAKRFVIGTAVGGTTVFVAGGLLFTLPPVSDFYAYAMNAGSAVGVPRDSPVIWASFLGALSYGALVTLALGSRPGPTGIAAGMKIGAVVGFLLWFTANFMLYGVSNVGSVTSTILDPLLELVPGALAGGVVAGVSGKAGAARNGQGPLKSFA